MNSDPVSDYEIEYGKPAKIVARRGEILTYREDNGELWFDLDLETTTLAYLLQNEAFRTATVTVEFHD